MSSDDPIIKHDDPEESAIRQGGRYNETLDAIASIVKGLPKGTHITAPQVFEKAKEIGLDISLSTVYRTLHKLKADGEVSTIGGDRGLRYEAAEEGPDHDHLICLGCGLTIEFFDDLIRGFGKTVAQRKGFEHTSSRFDILGYCKDCRASDDSRKLAQTIDAITQAYEYAEEGVDSLRQALDLVNNRKASKATQNVEGALEKLRLSIMELENSLALLGREPM